MGWIFLKKKRDGICKGQHEGHATSHLLALTYCSIIDSRVIFLLCMQLVAPNNNLQNDPAFLNIIRWKTKSEAAQLSFTSGPDCTKKSPGLLGAASRLELSMVLNSKLYFEFIYPKVLTFFNLNFCAYNTNTCSFMCKIAVSYFKFYQFPVIPNVIGHSWTRAQPISLPPHVHTRMHTWWWAGISPMQKSMSLVDSENNYVRRLTPSEDGERSRPEQAGEIHPFLPFRFFQTVRF